MPVGTLKSRWENGRVSSEIISTGYIFEQPSGISISCFRLKVDDRDDLVLYFERMELRKDGFHLWLAGFVYTIPVAEDTGFTLELIEPVPVQMSMPLNPRLMSPGDYCYVHVFLLNNNSHFKTLKAQWRHIPFNARMEEKLGAIVERIRFRYLVGQALSDPFTLTEIFENRNIFESAATKSFVLYMHDQNAVPFRFQGRYVTTEGLPDICESAVMSAIRRDPELKNQDIRRVATIAMSGGLALDKLNAIGWNSRNYPSEALDWSQAFSPHVVEADVLSKYQGACQTFIEHKPLESLNERSLCQSS